MTRNAVLGSWFLVLGSWFLVLGSWFLVADQNAVGANAGGRATKHPEPSTKTLPRLGPGRDGGLAGGLGGFDDARGGAPALVRQPALTVRVDAGVRALFDRRAFGFLEALDASTHA